MRSVVPLLILFLLLPAFVYPEAAVEPFDAEKAAQAAKIDDPATATRAYLDSVPQERRAKTKSYALGNYALDFFDFLFTGAVLFLILISGLSRRMRDFARRLTRFRPLQTATYWIQFLVLTTLISFPLTLYRGFFRERAYGLLTQSFGGWMTDQGIGLAIGCVLGSLLLMLLYGVLRRTPRTWWLWGSVVMIIFLIFTVAIAPVFIMPLFNKFTPIQDSDLREKILNMAHAHNIPADEVYEMDASRRTDRISAFVNGMMGTMRIVMFDNTLKRCTSEEIQMIMGHEMGHYVMNHIWKGIAFFGILIILSFLFVRWSFGKVITRWPRMGVEGVSDPAGFPLLFLLLMIVIFITSPATNTWSRTLEDHADDFGLEASQQPDAAATTFLKLGEYRDLDPHPIVEFFLYDHPSGRYRIRNAMEWKKNH